MKVTLSEIMKKPRLILENHEGKQYLSSEIMGYDKIVEEFPSEIIEEFENFNNWLMGTNYPEEKPPVEFVQDQVWLAAFELCYPRTEVELPSHYRLSPTSKQFLKKLGIEIIGSGERSFLVWDSQRKPIHIEDYRMGIVRELSR